jgi:hypothetical protein
LQLYNHPTVIRDEFSSARRKQRNSGLTKSGLKNLEEKMDVDMAESVKSSHASTASTFRPKGETPEERKQRKQVKNLREEKMVSVFPNSPLKFAGNQGGTSRASSG